MIISLNQIQQRLLRSHYNNWYLIFSQNEAKIEKLKGKLKRLEQVEQLNLDLQQEIIALKKDKRSRNHNKEDKVISDSMKSLAKRVTPKLSDDEVRFRTILVNFPDRSAFTTVHDWPLKRAIFDRFVLCSYCIKPKLIASSHTELTQTFGLKTGSSFVHNKGLSTDDQLLASEHLLSQF